MSEIKRAHPLQGMNLHSAHWMFEQETSESHFFLSMKVPPLQAVNIKVFFSKNTFLEVHSSSYLKLSANNNVPVSETGSSDCQRFVFIGDEGECGHDDPPQVWQTSPAMK